MLRLLHWCNILWMILSCFIVFGAPRTFLCLILILIRSFIAQPLAVGALNCSSLGGAGLWRSHKTEEVLCAHCEHRFTSKTWMLALNSSVLFISNSLFSTCFYTFFHRVKEPKRPARAKISHNSLLLTSRKRHPSFGCCLPQTTFRSIIGDKRTRFPRNNSNKMNTAQTAFVLFRCLNGCLL